jgi:hypothetical protein
VERQVTIERSGHWVDATSLDWSIGIQNFWTPAADKLSFLAGQRRARGEPQNSEALFPKLCLFGRGARQQGRCPCLLYRAGLKVLQRGLDTAMPGQCHGLGEGHVLATSFGHES